jgi:hypothetical protein
MSHEVYLATIHIVISLYGWILCSINREMIRREVFCPTPSGSSTGTAENDKLLYPLFY